MLDSGFNDGRPESEAIRSVGNAEISEVRNAEIGSNLAEQGRCFLH